jgi:nitroimidazol reductase NimA-like FMN-containing flavoprotein (pyridoxamine 5'-phosphate oxidase superfamily)
MDGLDDFYNMDLFDGPFRTHGDRMDRTQLRRKPARGSHERDVIDRICDDALICHVGFVASHGPVVIPTTFVRIGPEIHIHGSVGSAMLTALAEGGQACVTITLIDALVLAKTALHHSANYRSVVAFGRGRVIEQRDDKIASLAALLEKIERGRSRACRPPNDKELAMVRVVALPLTEASAKIRTGGPLRDETPEDAALPYWAGLIPLVLTRGERVPA